MRTLAKLIVTCAAILGVGITSSNAAVFSFSHMLKAQFERVAFQTPVMGPFAYTHFCVRYADECRIHGFAFRRPKPVVLTEARWKELAEVNRTVNASIEPHHYVNDTSYDTWRIGPVAGDCNDYAVTKRHELLARGWPSRALLLSEVITSWGEHHLVLLVRTADQDVVLDNLNANIKSWTRTPYKWVRVQSPFEPALWSTINATRPSQVS